VGFEPTTPGFLEVDWKSFDQYLDNNSYRKDHTYWRNIAKRYYNILVTGNASPLLTLTQSQRLAALKSLTNLSKFLGCYQKWREIVQRYNLKWSKTLVIPFMERIDLTTMLHYLQDVKLTVTQDVWHTFVFDTLTGLRANECCQAIKLLQSNTEDYYNSELGILQHYKFKDIFLRNSKNAYISIVDNDMIEIAKSACPRYQKVRSALRRQNKEMNMAFCRKIFATYLRDKGIPTEMIDILQGRVNTSIFSMHYYRPDFNSYCVKIKSLLHELHHIIVCSEYNDALKLQQV
jgi:hypothetical protein